MTAGEKVPLIGITCSRVTGGAWGMYSWGHFMDYREVWVNGRHHQAIQALAPELKVAARAKDGIVEAVEHPGKRFAIGVQWHPEGTWREDVCSKKLFRPLVRAAREGW